VSVVFLVSLPPEDALLLLTWLYVVLYFLYWLVIWWLTYEENLSPALPFGRSDPEEK
jgi:hypothetical protein